MKKQVVIIHGGDVHNSYEEYLSDLRRHKADKEDFLPKTEKSWKDNMPERLGDEFEVFLPEMPNWNSAKYVEWCIWFEKILPFLNEGTVFVGHSLGGIFLARYFAENTDKKKTSGVFLVSAPYRDAGSDDQLADFVLPKDLSRLEKLAHRLHLYHSEDDPIATFGYLGMYAKLLPSALTTAFTDRGHFRQAEFPELVRDIREAFKTP